MIEAALAVPILIGIVIGVMEFGLLFMNYSKSVSASRSGARVAASVYSRADSISSVNNGPESPAQALALTQIVDAVEGDMKNLNSAVPVRMMIYRVASDGQPAGGINGTCSDRCISYTWNDTTKKMVRDSSAKRWPNPQRCLINNFESIGVYVEVRHDFITPMFGQSKTVGSKTTMRLEPGTGAVCS